MMAMSVILDLIIKIMDDKYLKTIFWILVGLYTLAVIGLWESLIKPIFGWLIRYVYPLLVSLWGYLVTLF